MHKASLFITIMALLVTAPAAYAELYSWTDRKGTNHFTDDLAKVPDAYRAQALANKMPDEEKAGAAREEQQDGQLNSGYRTTKKQKKAQSDTEHTDAYGRGEAYWRERADTLRQRLEELQQDYEDVCSQERACQETSARSPGRREDCPAIYRHQKTEIMQDIEQTRKSLEVDLPDEARKLDAYPGWLR